jgi:hypothetical protein
MFWFGSFPDAVNIKCLGRIWNETTKARQGTILQFVCAYGGGGRGGKKNNKSLVRIVTVPDNIRQQPDIYISLEGAQKTTKNLNLNQEIPAPC